MRVAEVVCVFPPYKGGIGRAALDNSIFLSKGGKEVTVFTPYYNKSGKEAEEFGNIKRLLPFFSFGNAAILPQLFWQLKNFKVVHLHYPFFGSAEMVWLFKKFCGKKIKLIITYHMEVTMSGFPGLILGLYRKYLMPRILNSADKIIVSSKDYALNCEIKDIFIKNQEKFIELPYGVDTERYKPRSKDSSLMSKYNIKDDEKVILFVGGLDKPHYFKGIPKLIKAFYNFQYSSDIKSRLVIVGEGNLRFDYEQVAFDYGLRDKVIFAGNISFEELPKFYNLADLFVLPSLNKSEAFGIVLLEAMSSGVPVIASDLPGVRSVVSGSIAGLLANPGDSDDLAAKIKSIMEDDAQRKEKGLNARKGVEEKYDIRDINKKFNEIFND